MVAASVTFLSRFMLKPNSHPWVRIVYSQTITFFDKIAVNFLFLCVIFVLQNLTLEQLSGYTPSDLKECVTILHELQSSRRCGNLVAIREKYKQHKVCATFSLSNYIILVSIALKSDESVLFFLLQFKCVGELLSPLVIPSSFFNSIKER